jgi:hypothetical protein
MKNAQISNFINICEVETNLCHADRQTGVMYLRVLFRNFARVPKSYSEESDFTELGNI